MLHSRKKRAVGDMIGAVILIIMMISVVVLLGLAVSSFFTTQQSLHNVSTIHQLENEENFTVVQEAHVPPSGSPGILITNNGLALNITNLIARNSVGSLVFTPVSVVVGHLQSVSIPVSVNTVGFMTSYGGVFFYNFSSPGLVPVSIMAYETTIESPYSAGLWYVPVGTAVNVHSADRGTWYVNGSAVTNGKSSSSVTVDGPTSITVVRDYYVSVSTNPAGAGSVSPVSGWYPVGTQLTFSEIPFASSTVRYIFTSWSGTYSSTSTSFSETVSGPITETANYITQFYVSISSPNGWGNPQGAGWYNAGSTATVSVTSPYSTGAGSQVVFSSWSGTLDSNSNPFSFTVNSPISENVNWIQQYYVSVSASPSGGASSLSPLSGWYDAGAQVTFSETPNTGAGYQYVFQSWSGTYSSASASFSETVNQPITETANYQLQYYLTMNVNPAGAGSVSPSSEWFNAGSQVGISAASNSGYVFQSWAGSGSGSYSGASSSTTITMNGPITETANFLYTITFTMEQASGSSPSPGAAISGVTITLVSSGGTQYTGATNSQGQISFNVPAGTYSLSVENPVPISSGEEFNLAESVPSSITVTGPASYMYNYAELYWVTAGVNPSGAGTVSLSPSSGLGNWFWYGYGLTFSETPATGSGFQYAFQSWTGTYSSTASSFSETVTQPITETANYQAQYLVTATSSNYNEYIWAYQGGSVIGPYTGSVWLNAGDQVFATSQFAIYGHQYMSSGVITSTQLVNGYVDWGGQTYGGYPNWWFNNPQGNFVMAFYGWFTAPSTGTYTIATTSDDGSAVWISTSPSMNPATSSPVVNNWYQQGATQRSGTISLTAGQLYYIIVAYEQGNGGYMVNLQWIAPGSSSYTEMPVTGTAYIYGAPFVSSSTSTVYSPGASGNPSTETFYGGVFWSTLSLNAPATVSPSWSPVEYYLTMEANPSGGGSVSPSSGWYNYGASPTISETPASGYTFTGWLGAGPGSYSGSSGMATITIGGAVTEMAGFTNPNVPIYITTLNIANSQSAGANSPFQQMFTFNPSNYTAYEAPNLGNIRFYYTNGTELYSWLESYSGQPSGGNANQAKSATVWINLHGMPAGGSVQVYMEFYSTSTNFDGNYWGEAPQLSSSYGQYDNGQNVFPAGYFNFAGTTMPSGWDTTGVTSGGITVNNGLTVDTNDIPNYVLTLSSSLSGNYVVDAYEVSDVPFAYLGAQFSSWSTSSTAYPASTNPSSGAAQWSAPLSTGGESMTLQTSSSAYAALSENIDPISVTNWQVDSAGVYGSTAYMWVNYGYQLSTGTNTGSNYPGVTGWNSAQYTVQWFRIRTTPPNGVMPTVTIL